MMTEIWNKIGEWLAGPCTSCGDSSSPLGVEHVAMPVTRPPYVEDYLSEIAGPNEQHEANPNGHCMNPKCRATFGEEDVDSNGIATCPECFMEQDTHQDTNSPGGTTRAGLTLKQMGDIGEKVVARMGELPGVGVISWVSPDYNHPIDAIVASQRGNFGCEIKTNHSQAQERFKVGGKIERQEKIKYCLTNGLKPALIGVRLNFYTDKAYIFFREGLTDTWIGNAKMMHVATLDFSDLNPFKSPDPQAQALAVENANLPDQSEDDIPFGKVAADSDPGYLYVYYMGELNVQPYDTNVSFERLLEELLDRFGAKLDKDIDPTKVDAGEIRIRGFHPLIEHKQLCEPEVREYAERAIQAWWQEEHDKQWDKVLSPWGTLPSEDQFLGGPAAL